MHIIVFRHRPESVYLSVGFFKGRTLPCAVTGYGCAVFSRMAIVSLLLLAGNIGHSAVTEDPNEKGHYLVNGRTNRSRDEILASFSNWQSSVVSHPPNLSIALWSVDQGVLSTSLSNDSGKSSRIELNDINLATLREFRAGPWQIVARSRSDPTNHTFVGYLAAASDASQVEDRQQESAANKIAYQALQDIYDLAMLAQSSGKDTRSTHAPISSTSTKQAHGSDADGSPPPYHQKVPPLLPLVTSPTLDDACPYPSASMARGETGTVVLLVQVSGDGSPLNVVVEQSSGFTALDQSTAQCVQRHAVFASKHAGGRPLNYWGRMRFSWTFGQ